MAKFSLLVTGGRDYPRLQFVEQVINGLITYPSRKTDIDDLYVGDARGVDAEAKRVYEEITNRKAKVFRADWKKYKLGAGPIRNRIMVDAWLESGGGIALAFWDGKSVGTKNCMDYLHKKGKMVLIPDAFQDINKEGDTGDLRLRIWQGEETL